MIPILDCVPNKDIKLRPQQVAALLWIEANFFKYRYLFIDMPVGCGKSWVVATVNNWLEINNLGRSADITPTKLLQDQYTGVFPWIPDLKGQNSYKCSTLANGGTCADHKRFSLEGKLCGGVDKCAYMAARADATNSKTAIFNFHSYYYNNMCENKDHMFIDEGHNTRAFLEGLYSLDLWSCEIGFDKDYPTDPKSIKLLIESTYQQAKLELNAAIARRIQDSLIEELEELIMRLEKVSAGLDMFGKDILVVKKTEVYKRKKWLKRDMREFTGKEQTLIKIKPLKLGNIANDLLWVPEIKRVMFLSATLDESDIDDLGIDPSERAIFRSDSPIPPDRRKFIVWPVANMGYKHQKDSMPAIVNAIKTIADKNKDSKGVIHCTYSLSKMLKEYVGDNPRFIFHTESDKTDVYYRFRENKNPVILVACGMSEGIDLPDDYARWQIIMKVIYPSLADDVWSWKSVNKPRAYIWETVKTIIQQSGRICRSPTDKGYTYILDSEFGDETRGLFKKGLKYGMWPKWFRDSMVFIKGK